MNTWSWGSTLPTPNNSSTVWRGKVFLGAPCPLGHRANQIPPGHAAWAPISHIHCYQPHHWCGPQTQPLGKMPHPHCCQKPALSDQRTVLVTAQLSGAGDSCHLVLCPFWVTAQGQWLCGNPGKHQRLRVQWGQPCLHQCCSSPPKNPSLQNISRPRNKNTLKTPSA